VDYDENISSTTFVSLLYITTYIRTAN